MYDPKEKNYVDPATNKPKVQRGHVKGPYIHYANGQVRWLTQYERFGLWVGFIKEDDLE